MAAVTAVKTKKPVVESVTLELSRYDVNDVMLYIESYYQRNGYGQNAYKTNGVYKELKDALDGKHIAVAAATKAPF